MHFYSGVDNDKTVKQLSGERDAIGNPVSTPPDIHTPASFWEYGLGVVTPHRAQQGLVVSRLTEVFRPLGHSEAQIRSAVDTVERFQGQERDVMIASLALGDPDSIRDEDEFLYSLTQP